MKTPVSQNFTYEEFEYSKTANDLGIDNKIPSEKIRFAIRLLVLNLLQPLRDLIQRPLIVTSGYRTPALNKIVGGSKNSQHTKGEAADLFCNTPLGVLLLAQVVVRNNLPFDQMILYDTIVHLSFKAKGAQRYQIRYDKSYKLSRL